ncbi:class I SAM-dependent DNA methyltransferase [Caenispirillum bisanense]|uniref:Methyltransferase domain-containing protein n=1 Tax=Caenispirillum bisanense TaxID=414052 RepID=A0A286H086_9PROT|nr:class I SAM-dependent methyltransferase [Caenispirillum bisanense]SOE00866.1 Methyltransferase domain-containing protein [Caenispirillum bisanense]
MIDGDTYDALVAELYDDILADVPFGDLEVWAEMVRTAEAPALELACGTGRVLLPLLARGLAVEGLDVSEAMLAVCRRKAAAQGLAPVLHRAAMQDFDLGRRFGAVFCPVASLSLLTADGSQAAVLACAFRHLRPGGVLALAMDDLAESEDVSPPADAPAVLHREARRADGSVVRVHRRPLPASAAGVTRTELVYTVEQDGRVVTRAVRAVDLRPPSPEAMRALLTAAGFTSVGVVSGPGGDGFLATARRPAAT